MAWTTPITWSTGQVVTATQLNEQVRDNTQYLYNSMNTVSVGSTSNVLDTVYQNTTGMLKFVSIAASCTSNASLGLFIGTANPPTIRVSYDQRSTNPTADWMTISGIIPPAYYYSASTGAATLRNWVEWNLHAT